MTKIRIGPFDYIYLEKDNLETKDGISVVGEIRYNDLEIHVEKGLLPSKRIHTLLHEVFHGILNNMSRDDLCEDETFVDCFSLNVLQFMRDNPTLVTQMIRDIQK